MSLLPIHYIGFDPVSRNIVSTPPELKDKLHRVKLSDYCDYNCLVADHKTPQFFDVSYVHTIYMPLVPTR